MKGKDPMRFSHDLIPEEIETERNEETEFVGHSRSLDGAFSPSKRMGSGTGKEKETYDDKSSDVEGEEGETELEFSDQDEDVIWEALDPRISEESERELNLNPEEIEKIKKRWAIQSELYESNLARGIPYAETGQMLYRKEIALRG